MKKYLLSLQIIDNSLEIYMKRFCLLFLLTTSPLIFAQCLDGDCQNGNGKFKFKNGTYVGTFLDGEIHGQGVFSTRRGHSYDGEWVSGEQSGFGQEMAKKTVLYRGEFENGVRHGEGVALLPESYVSKFFGKGVKDVSYNGEWNNDVMCGEGELTYYREVKYGKERVWEKNHLKGTFVNGIYQGRQTSPYLDELSWEEFGLEMEHFQKHKPLTEKEQKRIKNPATIEGQIILSCECVGNTLIFDASAILRKDLSWWSTEIIATDTKQEIKMMMQGEFNIIEWHARKLEAELNKQKLKCGNYGLAFASNFTAWSELVLAEKEANRVRKIYSSETAWNPKRGNPKNPNIQQKWNQKIKKKLTRYYNVNDKLVSRLKKKANKLDAANGVEQCFNPFISEVERLRSKELLGNISGSTTPIKKELTENVTANKKDLNKPRRSFKPHFPRANQLE